MSDRPAGNGAAGGSGGPGDILLGTPDIDCPSNCPQSFAWRMLMRSEHVVDLLAEWVEWDHRRALRQASHGVSSAPRIAAGAPTYSTLERRRNERTIPAWAVKCNAELARRREAA